MVKKWPPIGSIERVLIVFPKVNGGREGRPIGAYELAKAVEELGAGEILLNCIDCDGEKSVLYSMCYLDPFRSWTNM